MTTHADPDLRPRAEGHGLSCADGVLESVVARALHPTARTGRVALPVLAEIAHRLALVVGNGELELDRLLRSSGAVRDARHDGGRAYARLVDSPSLEVWLIEWGPAAMLDLHDHGGSAGAVEVLSGGLVETSASSVGRRVLRSRQVDQGEHFSFGPECVHEIWNPSGVAALSLHAYSPRLTSMTFYGHDGSGLGAPLRTEHFESSAA